MTFSYYSPLTNPQFASAFLLVKDGNHLKIEPFGKYTRNDVPKVEETINQLLQINKGKILFADDDQYGQHETALRTIVDNFTKSAEVAPLKAAINYVILCRDEFNKQAKT